MPSDVNNFKSFWTKEAEKSLVFYRIVHLRSGHDMAKHNASQLAQPELQYLRNIIVQGCAIHRNRIHVTI